MIVVSGLSGAGKTIALNTLEDVGYYCIDNLPIALLSQLDGVIDEARRPIAVGVDIRNMTKGSDIQPLRALKDNGNISQLLFLNAQNDEILKRYNESRRKHPLSDEHTTLLEAIETERAQLSELSALADISIDTSQLNIYDLAARIHDWLVTHERSQALLTIESFGFKNGAPNNADLLFDVRFLPNPHWHKDLRPFNGNDPEIIDFLSKQPDTLAFVKDTRDFLEKWLPAYRKSNRAYVTVAIGCTGGKHRSVFVAGQLALALQAHFHNVRLRHRDLKTAV